MEDLSGLLDIPIEDLEFMRDRGAPFEKDGRIDFIAFIAWLVIEEGKTHGEN